jgi:hypothetical protein
MVTVRAKPGALRQRVAANLLSGRPAYDPAKGESWIVFSSAVRSARRYRRANKIRRCDPRIDVIGVDPEPRSIDQALVTLYAIGAVVETLTEEGMARTPSPV